MARVNCEDCKFFTPIGIEDFYCIGKCSHPKPTMGGAMVNYGNIASWLTCYQAEPKKVKAKTKES